MIRTGLGICMAIGAGLLTLPALARVPAPGPDLSRRALAVLEKNCLACHGVEKKGALDLRTRAAALRGGDRGPALVAGKSAESLLYKVVSGAAKPAMPLGRSLSPDELSILKGWIDAGAVYPSKVQSPKSKAGDAGDVGRAALDVGPAKHWSFIPPVRPRVPAAKVKGFEKWARNPVDAFVLDALRKKGLVPSPEADKRTLIRRVSLDLTGLPPTPEEIDAYLSDRSPDAYEKVVRRLLASPQYGERWAQHWLDVVRFAETNGFELDADRPQAWRYRDWVVRALNEDKPYDRFLTEQIAGDELAPDNFEMRVATGFLRAGPRHVVGGNVDKAVDRNEWLTEAVAGVGSSVMGITIGCARCHDHKFDPLPQKDYYRLAAFFAASDSVTYQPEDLAAAKAFQDKLKAHQEKLKPLKDEIAGIEKPYRERLRAEKMASLKPELVAAMSVPAAERTPAQKRLAAEANVLLKVEWDTLVKALSPADAARRSALRRRMFALDWEAPEPLPAALAVADVLQPTPKVHLLVRGDEHNLGDEVQPAYPAVLCGGADPNAVPATVGKSTGRRTALAKWLTRPEHPLTARVIVNRLWQYHFGRGLVATPNDFGKNGQRPSHPELLDYLATTFAAAAGETGKLANEGNGRSPKPVSPISQEPGLGWSLKRLHYFMVTSSAYRQASNVAAKDAERVDPENRLLWRMNAQRLDAEALRDSVLRVSGQLNLQAGGPSIRVPLEPEVYDTIFTEGEPDNLWPVHPDRSQHVRRSLYLLHKRNVRLPMLAVFDQPDMMTSCGARGQSVHALQALTLMNSEFMVGQARALAARVLNEAGPEAGIQRLYVLALGRPPRPQEVAATERFLRDQTSLMRSRAADREPVAKLDGLKREVDPATAAAWADLCLAVLNLNEFVYVK